MAKTALAHSIEAKEGSQRTSGGENKDYWLLALELSCQGSGKKDVGGLRLAICGPRIIILSVLPSIIRISMFVLGRRFVPSNCGHQIVLRQSDSQSSQH